MLNSPRRPACDVRPNGVEHHPCLLVLVETEEKHVAQKAPALRNAEQIRALDRTGARVAVRGRPPAQPGAVSRTARKLRPTSGGSADR
jgi:hypothetical protein